MFSYHNGNYDVHISKTGVKTRTLSCVPVAEFPETADVKITNFCDAHCPYCHEQSSSNGKHGNLELGLEKTRDLPPGFEMAIGGGNALAHPGLLDFLRAVKSRGHIPNLTVNQRHFKSPVLEKIRSESLIYGLGVSLVSSDIDVGSFDPNTVLHVIAGVHDFYAVERIVRQGIPRLLILGYKNFGNGKKFYSPAVDKNIHEWFMWLPRLCRDNMILSFDNLAIEQLRVRRLLDPEEYRTLYMGDDGKYSCYIDLVKEEYAMNSTSITRFPLQNVKSAKDLLVFL